MNDSFPTLENQTWMERLSEEVNFALTPFRILLESLDNITKALANDRSLSQKFLQDGMNEAIALSK